MADIWKGFGPDFGSNGRKLVTVTADNSNDLADVARELIVLTAGTLVIIPADNADIDTLTFGSLAAGTRIPVQTRRVKATGTSATVAAVVG